MQSLKLPFSVIEDLPAMAHESFTLALANCGDCRDYHATWGYLRATGFRQGATIDRALITQRLASLGRNPRVLIVGSADTGQVAAVANALAGRDFSLTLVDICDTPLKLCAAFAAHNSIPLETRRCDVRNIDPLGHFDTILLHNFIGFIPTDDRVTVLSELRRALTEQGRLLLFQRIYGHRDEDHAKAPSPPVDSVLDMMRARNINMPESPEVFAQRLHAALNSSARETRTKVFKTSGDVEALLRQAGFRHVVATAFVDAADRDKSQNWRPPNRRHLFDAG